MKVFDFLMSKFGKYSIFAFALVVLVSAASILLLALSLAQSPTSIYIPLVQLMFELLLFFASLWFGVSISNEEARKNAASKWLQAAEVASMELLAMSEAAKRLRWKQGRVCQSIDKIIPDLPLKESVSVKALVGTYCEGCKTNMADLQNRIDNIYQHWNRFIAANCSDSECSAFREVLDNRQKAIQATFESAPPIAVVAEEQIKT